ncbi:hypothetical protein [Candidatus Uabimicrobium sp. HlEnr_7]|uniref:hypothetical protein n=1 Tax=Candidatus Uabimicrobium helgolandensis TaxID=3095367 RepID=UPI003559295C
MIALGTLAQKKQRVTGIIMESKKAPIAIDLDKHTLRFKVSGVNIGQATSKTLLVNLQIGNFNETRVISLEEKVRTYRIDFHYK